jgi:DNA-binding CsgD family transcriptional regulator
MNTNPTPNNQSFETRLANIRRIADELPSVLIIHKTEDLSIVFMNGPGLDAIGISPDELQQLNTANFQVRFQHLEDSTESVPKMFAVFRTKTADQISSFQKVKNSESQEWQLYAQNTKVFQRDEAGDATHVITIAGKIDPLHHITSKVSRLMDELSFLKTNNRKFLTLTKREVDVLRLMALGKSSSEISEALFISPTTVDTHRKKVRNKLGIKNTYETLLFAQAYDLI